MVNCLLLSMDDVSLVIGVEVRGVSQDFEEAADPLLRLVLSLLLDID
jgi:hypothetical protein